jgi:PPM family protein phosphatase
MLIAHGITDTGRVRKSNEDALFWSVELGLFVVADGMGGHNAGEVASQLAVDTLRAFIEKTEADADSTMPYGLDTRISADGNRLATAIRLANTHVFHTSESRPDYSGMGTTVVAALVRDEVATFAGVGDSRLYSWLGGDLIQLTEDDSWVARIRREHPDVTDEMIASNPMRHVLTNVIGGNADTPVDIAERTLQDRELLMLCSDGLYGPLEGDALGGLMPREAGDQDLEALATRLVTAALDAGSRDNVTVLLVQYRAG